MKPSGGLFGVKDHQHKNWIIECEYCKCHIKSISEGNILIVGINKVIILSFVVRNSHRFSFVFWVAIGLARKNWPNVNQFFESLYFQATKCGFTTGEDLKGRGKGLGLGMCEEQAIVNTGVRSV